MQKTHLLFSSTGIESAEPVTFLIPQIPDGLDIAQYKSTLGDRYELTDQTPKLNSTQYQWCDGSIHDLDLPFLFIKVSKEPLRVVFDLPEPSRVMPLYFDDIETTIEFHLSRLGLNQKSRPYPNFLRVKRPRMPQNFEVTSQQAGLVYFCLWSEYCQVWFRNPHPLLKYLSHLEPEPHPYRHQKVLAKTFWVSLFLDEKPYLRRHRAGVGTVRLEEAIALYFDNSSRRKQSKEQVLAIKQEFLENEL